ncbi:hypothetical protein [Streptomyces sp. NPDC057616]|uniref:hypothetical protein n=1 Tax=Streptomyces sp. NPDC057616 TaxID=3346183 RepID=UPI0036774F29
MTARLRGGPPGGGGSAPIPAHAVRLRRLNRWQAEAVREDLADLYVECSRPRASHEHRDREAFLRRLTSNIRRAGFALLTAEVSAFAGCAYGFPVPREGTWWRGLDGALPESVEQLTASGRVFAITEIVVHHHTDGQDLARRLQERLLADHHASLGATLVDQADAPACDAFLSWGWQDIGAIRRPSEATVLRPSPPVLLRALVLPLSPHTAAGPLGPARVAEVREGIRRS